MAARRIFYPVADGGFGGAGQYPVERRRSIAESPALGCRFHLQLVVLSPDDDRGARPVGQQYLCPVKLTILMRAKEGNGLFDGGAAFEGLLTRITPDDGYAWVGLPFFRVARHPVEGEPFCVHSALSIIIIKADVDPPIMFVTAGDKPNPRFWIRPILIVAEQSPVGIRQHENRAGINPHRHEAEQSRAKTGFHQ